MQKVEGDPATLVAATLALAEATMRGGLLAGRKPGATVGGNVRDAVTASYEHYLALVTTGARPQAVEPID